MAGPGKHGRHGAFVLRLVLVIGILLQLAGPPTAIASSAGPPSLPSLPVLELGGAAAPLASWVRNVVLSVAGQQTTVPATANVALSTPWTAFAGGVNAVQGNVSLAQADLAIPSVGFATTVGRAYNSAAADISGPFGYGWTWSYGVRVIAQAGSAVIVREDGRADTYTLSGGSYTAPAGIYDQLVKNGDGSWTLTRRDQVRYELSAAGQLQRIVDPNNNALTVSYTGTAPSGLTDTAGRAWAIQTDGSGRITHVTDPASRSSNYEYNVAGDLVKVTDPLGKATVFAYDAAHRLTGTTDANTHATTYAYDGGGKVTAITDPAGNAVAVAYNAGARTVTFTDLRGNSVTYTSDASARVTGVTDAKGQTETWAWDASNTRTSVTDRNGGVTTSTYDARGNVLDLGDAAGGHVISTYDAGNRPLTRRDQLNRTTTFAYDAKGNLTGVTNPASQTTTHAYDAKGQRTSTTDAESHTTTFAYDANGNRISVTNALSTTTTATYDAAGRVLTETDPDGRTTTRTYDAVGRVLTVTDGAGGVAHSTYDPVGNRLTSVDPRGHTTRYEYDVRDLLMKLTDADGKVTTYEYDAVRNRTKVTDPLGKVTTSTYDQNNRVVSVKDPNNNTVRFEYDDVGNQTKQIAPLNRPTVFEYDALNRLTEVTDPLGGRATYEYDAVGNRTGLTDPNGHTSHSTYDVLNRPLSWIDPLTNTLAYQYDDVGNLLKKTSAKGEVTTYVYDAANRLVTATYPEGTVSYAYDGAGNRTGMTDQTGTTTYQYDGARRLTRNAAPNGAVSYEYDPNGNLTKLAYPGGNDVTYQYDELSRVVGVTDWNGLTSGFGYDANGRRISASHPNGTRATYGYDNGGRVTSIQWTGPGGASVAGITYTYDAAGNRTKVVDGSGTSNFTYDGVDRLTHAVYGDGRTVDYEYDPAGNRTKMTDAGQITFYNFDAANRLVAAGGQTITWDNNGNVQSHGTTTYRWDSQNRLLEVKKQDQVTQMAYDGANRRVSRLAGGQKNEYVFDEHGELARAVKESNAQRSQLYGLDGQVLWDATSDQGQLYYHQDAIGSTVAMTKSDGSLAGARQYDAFGAPRNPVGTMPGSFWFAGEQYDQDTSLIYLRARYYDPVLGRFLSVDPKIGDIKNTQSLNPYAYALNNPLRYTDSSGEWVNIAIGAAIGVTIGVAFECYNGCSWGEGLGAAASGALTGGVAGATMGMSLGASIVAQAAAGATGSLVEQAFRGDTSIDLGRAAVKGTMGAAGATLGWAAGQTSTLANVAKSHPSTFTGIVVTSKQAAKFWSDVYFEVIGDWIGSSVDQILDLRSASGSTGQVLGTSTSTAAQAIGIQSGFTGYTAGLSVNDIAGLSRSSDGRQMLRNLGVVGGAATFVGNAPSAPKPVAPYSWFVTVGAPPTLQWEMCGSPDERPVTQSKVRIKRYDSSVAEMESPWITGTSFTPVGLPYGTYEWAVQCRDDRGIEGPFNNDRWAFTVYTPQVQIDRDTVHFLPTNNSETVGVTACTTGGAGLNIGLGVLVSDANDGSTNGQWNIIKQLGVPCFDQTQGNPDHPEWQTLTYADGPHVVRVQAFKTTLPSEDPK